MATEVAGARPARRGGRARTPVVAGCVGLAILLAVGLVTLVVGQPTFSPVRLWHLLWGGPIAERVLAWQVRLPRFVLAALAGGLLALSGTLVQDVLRNALAGPELLAVSSGAAAVMAAIIVLQLPIGSAWQPWLALAGGLGGGGTVMALSWGAASPEQAVLIGASVSALLDGVITAIISLGQQSTITLLYQYLVGDLTNRVWAQVEVVLPWLAVVPTAYLLAPWVNVLRLGEEAARGLGLRAAAVRAGILCLAVAAVAPVIATCGPIGYVALLAPHAARRVLATSDARRVLPVAVIFGAVLLSAADLVAQVLLDPLELPAGVFTVLLGGPVLLLVLRHRAEWGRP